MHWPIYRMRTHSMVPPPKLFKNVQWAVTFVYGLFAKKNFLLTQLDIPNEKCQVPPPS